MVLLTSTEGIVGKQFQSYDMHVCDFSLPVSGRPSFLRTTRGGARGKVKNEIMQINGKKGGLFSSLGLCRHFSWICPSPLACACILPYLKRKSRRQSCSQSTF